MNAPALTPADIERGYNNRAAVPDYLDFFKRWADDSAQARADLACELDLRYGSRPKETLDLFKGGGQRGLLVFIHGGYWRSIDKSDYSYMARPWVAAGYDFASVNYDLCPEVPIATIVDECRNAIAWLARHGADHGVAGGRMVVSGHSAGGHLAAMMHATAWRGLAVDPAVVLGSVAISGVFDLRPLLHASMNADLRLDAASAATVSPVLMQPALAVPLLLAVGANETSEFIRQTQLQWDAWPGVRPRGMTEPLQLPGCHHFSVVDRLAEPDDPLFRGTLDLFGPAAA